MEERIRSEDVKKSVEYLINEQINELDRVAEKEAKLFSSKVEQNATNIEFLKEEYLEAIGDKQVFVLKKSILVY